MSGANLMQMHVMHLVDAVAGVAGSLDGVIWLLPDEGPWSGDPTNTHICACPATFTASSTLGGAAGVQYDVTLRFRGVVEARPYTGGTNDGAFWQLGGAPTAASPGWNEYKLTWGANYAYLNRTTTSNDLNLHSIDYNKTLTMTAGDLVTLFADAINGGEISNWSNTSNGAVTVPAQPYAGQFIRVDVVSIVLH